MPPHGAPFSAAMTASTTTSSVAANRGPQAFAESVGSPDLRLVRPHPILHSSRPFVLGDLGVHISFRAKA
jgi:hypothetical protein